MSETLLWDLLRGPMTTRALALTAELRIADPIGDAALKIVIREIIRRNGVDTGIVYLQITRGAAPREHAFPKAAKPNLVEHRSQHISP